MADLLRRNWLTIVLLLGCIVYLSGYRIFDQSLPKVGMEMIDEARQLRGDFALNDRWTPVFHPLYPFLLAATRPPGVDWESAGRSLSTVAMAVAIVLLWSWLRTVAGPRAAWTFVAFAAVNPQVVEYATQVQAEALGMLLLVCSAVAMWRVSRDGHRRWLAISGAAAGLYGLARIEGVLFVAWLPIGVAWMAWHRERNIRSALAAVLVATGVACVFLLGRPLSLSGFDTSSFGMIPDRKYVTAATALKRLPEPLWVEIQELPPMSFHPVGGDADRGMGVFAIESPLRQGAYFVQSFLVLARESERSLLAEMLGVAVILLMVPAAFSRKDPSEAGPSRTFLLYLILFPLTLIVAVAAAYDYGFQLKRNLSPLILPALALASIGADNLAEQLRSNLSDLGGRWTSFGRRPVPLIAVAGAVVFFGLLSVYGAVRLAGYRNEAREALWAAAEIVREASGPGPATIAADDSRMAYEADGWYVPLRQDSTAMEMARAYDAEFVVVQGWGNSPRRGGLAGLFTGRDVPPDLRLIGTAGDPATFNVRVYKVLPPGGQDSAIPAEPSPQNADPLRR